MNSFELHGIGIPEGKSRITIAPDTAIPYKHLIALLSLWQWILETQLKYEPKDLEPIISEYADLLHYYFKKDATLLKQLDEIIANSEKGKII